MKMIKLGPVNALVPTNVTIVGAKFGDNFNWINSSYALDIVFFDL